MNFWIEFKTWFALKLDIRNPKDLQRCIELSFAKGIAEAQVRAQRFLLEQAPMIDAPVGPTTYRGVGFAYIHPRTYSGLDVVNLGGARWIPTDLMPEGRVIYSPNPIPGIKP